MNNKSHQVSHQPLRSVISVFLSFPEPTNRWERPSHRYRIYPVKWFTGSGSNG